MKKKSIISRLMLPLIVVIFFMSCNKKESDIKETEVTLSDQSFSKDEPSKDTSDLTIKTYTFIDDAGRSVEIPTNLTRIAPTGPMAQTTLLSIAPDKLVAIASGFESAQEKYFDPKLLMLPEIGNLYADTLNLETILTAEPQLIIDIGVLKDTVTEDMDRIQTQTGIPTIFIHIEIESMAEGYRKLGKLLDETAQGEALAIYIENTLSYAKEKSSTIAESDKIRVYYGGEDGLTTYVADTVHSDVLSYVGAINVADIPSTVRAGGAEISMEMVILWAPDVAIFVPNTVYDTVNEDNLWSQVPAITLDSYYEGPMGPYNWMGRPPSISQIIGIKWAGNLLYPSVFAYDMIEETQTFFRLFYNYNITETEVRELLAHSTFKE